MDVTRIIRCGNTLLSRGMRTLKQCHSNNTRYLSNTIPVCSNDNNDNNGDCLKKGNCSVQDASKFLQNILGSCTNGSVFAGTGQYHVHENQDRVLVLNFLEDFIALNDTAIFDTRSILDCCVKHEDVDGVIDAVKSLSSLRVYTGEVDFINTSSWYYGFTVDPFCIFSVDERVCFLKGNDIYTSVEGKSEVISADEVDYVGLWLSEDPYKERRLLLGLKNKKNKTLIHMEKEGQDSDLAKLTVDTEWMMKAAALLCLNLKLVNSNVQLKMSPALQPVNNEWVAMRQKIWLDMIRKNTDNKDS